MSDKSPIARALLIDLDGVLYQGDSLIAGALSTLDWIRQQQIAHLFVTNTSSRSRAGLLDKFRRLGFSLSIEELMTPAVAATQWLAARQMRKLALFVPTGTAEEFAALESVPWQEPQPVDAVIVGDLGKAWDFACLNCAFRFLMQDPPPQLIALGMTCYWRGNDGLLLDVAPFIKALEHAANCCALVMGKPAAAFFEASLARLDCSADQALMIGDDIVGDIGAAQACGLRGIQVKTGKFRPADLNTGIEPAAILDSIADLPNWWQRQTTATS